MNKLAAGVATGLLLVAVSAGAAFAEGSWNSNLSGAVAGFSSRSWQDSHVDSAHTTTAFSTCSTDGPGFSSATLTLWDEQGLFPDVSMGSKVNYCNTSDWGTMTRSDQYHWSLSAVNGSNWAHLKVSSIHQTY